MTTESKGDGRERLVGVLGVLVVLGTAVIVLVMLASARRNGIDALEDAKRSQVDATASSFDSRVVSGIGGLTSLGAGWDLEEGSAEDRDRLESLQFDPDALAGFFLVDEDDVVTDGILLTDVEVGDRLDTDWWTEARATLIDGGLPAVVTPVGDGVTSDLPTFAFVIPIRDLDTGDYLGSVIFESAIEAQSSFNLEISRLAGDDEGAEWFFVDSAGAVVASNRVDTLGEEAPVPFSDLVGGTLLREGGRIYISADVPSVQWQVIFAQNAGDFEAALSDPLQVLSVVLAIGLGTVGVILVLVLVRRLAAAREEERRIRALASSQEEFVSIVSHELRTPVAGVLGFLQTSIDHWDGMNDDERLHAVRRAVSNARRLQALTRDVLDSESVEAGRLSFDLHPVDLVDEVRQAGEAANEIDRAREIEFGVPSEPLWVEADPDRLQQVLGNLLENARNNSPASTPITIEVGRTNGVATIAVTDRGAGIAPDMIDRVFDKFVRGRGSSVTGTGLGLYVSKRIIDAHDGSIGVTSGETGTTFTIQIPATDAPEDVVQAST